MKIVYLNDRMNTWIVTVANPGAKIFDDAMRLIHEIPHAQGKKRNREWNSDRPGRRSVAIRGSKYSLSPEKSAKDEERSRFLRQIVRYLENCQRNHIVNRFVLIAPNRILGEMRKLASKSLMQLIKHVIRKEMINAKDLRSYLEKQDIILLRKKRNSIQ